MKELEVIINNIDGVNVVSSRDVASGLSKRHDNVKRDLQNILKSHSSDLSSEIMLSKYTNNRGVTEIIKNRPYEQINWF